MLELSELACVRGERTLFDHVSFSLGRGQLLRVTGANGTGKTSLLRIVCGLLTPDEGEVRWNGDNIRKLREEYWKDLAYIGHLNALKDDLTAVENVEIASAVHGRAIARSDATAALEQLGVAACVDLPARVLSQGQRRRVALARVAVSARVPLWVLDEPFTGLDTHAVDVVQALVRDQLARGGSAIFTTHQEVSIVGDEARLDLDLDAVQTPA